VIPYIFSFICPFLLVMVLLQEVVRWSGRHPRGWISAIVIGCIAAGVVAAPVEGLPLGRWLISFNANFSIPLTATLLVRAVRIFFGIRLLDDRAVVTGWTFSLIAGAGLYPMALGLTRWDPYSAGWGFSWLFVLMFILTAVLLALKNRFAWVLMAAVVAYDLRVLESTNLWDYMIDPLWVMASGVGLGWKAAHGARDAA